MSLGLRPPVVQDKKELEDLTNETSSHSGEKAEYELSLPDGVDNAIEQDEEWCEVVIDGERRRIRFHDYDEIFALPGLYEQIFYDALHCTSPTQIRGMLGAALEAEGLDPRDLRVLDIGAGNGMVAEQLAELGAQALVGVDILEEAAEAAKRDRPGLYEAYHAVDLTSLSWLTRRRLSSFNANCLTCVAALGFGDMPPAAFAHAYNLVEAPGWLAFTIKEDFLHDTDPSGFSILVQKMIEEDLIDVRAQEVYRHRRSVNGKPLHYTAIIARKRADVPAEWIDSPELEGSGAAA